MGQVDPIRRCTAKSKQSGNRCKQVAILGGTTCHYHGGKAPQTIAAARRRLLELVDPALAALTEIVRLDDDPRTRLAAARDVLDRVGLREPEVIQVVTVDWVEAEIARLEGELAERGAIDNA